ARADRPAATAARYVRPDQTPGPAPPVPAGGPVRRGGRPRGPRPPGGAAAVAAAFVVVPRVATSVLNVNPNPTSNSAASGRSAPATTPFQGPNQAPGGTSESKSA